LADDREEFINFCKYMCGDRVLKAIEIMDYMVKHGFEKGYKVYAGYFRIEKRTKLKTGGVLSG
jgi:hypothetical protein